jgi:8-oxo-dGTP pyrophosphatase MutT (NUDIX family)
MPEWWPEKKLGAAAAIFDEHGRVLLVKHSYRRMNWELPGGAVEAREGVVDAAVREVHEETGLRVIAQHLTRATISSYRWGPPVNRVTSMAPP